MSGRLIPVNLKTVLGWVAVAFIIWWIIEDPAGASHVVHNTGGFLNSAAHGISDFFSCLGGCPVPGKKNQGDDWAAAGIILGSVLAGLGLVAATAYFVTHDSWRRK
jgi:hypothetical protein